MSAVLTVPLVLTACGSDENDQDDAAQSSTTTSATSSTKESPEDTAAESPEGEEPAPAEHPAEAPPAPAAEVPPLPEGPAPVPVSGTAAQADQDAIAHLVHGLSDGNRNLQDYTRYMVGRSCQAYIDRNGGAENLRKRVDSINQAGNINEFVKPPQITSVDNVTVNGDRATASVSATLGNEASTEQMQFQREGGAWKFCPA